MAQRTLVTELFLCKSREPLLATRDADPRELFVLRDVAAAASDSGQPASSQRAERPATETSACA